jgi:hypothetical protein
MEELNRRVDVVARNERRRPLREARRSQSQGVNTPITTGLRRETEHCYGRAAGGKSAHLPPSPAPSGLASVQGLRIIPQPDTEVSDGDEVQSK